jgi:hypothetical protein
VDDKFEKMRKEPVVAYFMDLFLPFPEGTEKLRKISARITGVQAEI